MEREIKFRAWDEESKTFLKGDFSLGIETSQFRGKYGEVFKNVKLMQFTGLKDKNGVDIYEGDICNFEIKGLGSGKSECYFIQGCFFLKVEGQQSPFPLFEYDNRSDIIIEILGNIHDNPNLLQ